MRLAIAFLSFWIPHFSHAFVYQDLVHLIQTRKLQTIETVLDELPRDFLSHFTLLAKPESTLQEGSETHPRVIVFGPTAKLVMSFNGDPLHAGFRSLEIIEFVPSRRAFDFYRILFSTTSGPSFSERNPATCLRCHQSDPRPNWTDYGSWPGAYGEKDDLPIGSELLNFRTFVDRFLPAPRYRSLNPLPGSINTPYEDRDRGRLRFRPNLRLMGLLFGMNSERVLRYLESKPNFNRWRFLFIMSRLKCDWSELDPQMELERYFGRNASRPLPPWERVSAESFFAYLLRETGLMDEDFTMVYRKSIVRQDPTYFPYGYYFGEGTFDKQPMLQADGVVFKMVESLYAELTLINSFSLLAKHYAPLGIAQKRFEDPLDLPYAQIIDDQLGSLDLGVLRGACGYFHSEYLRVRTEEHGEFR